MLTYLTLFSWFFENLPLLVGYYLAISHLYAKIFFENSFRLFPIQRVAQPVIHGLSLKFLWQVQQDLCYTLWRYIMGYNGNTASSTSGKQIRTSWVDVPIFFCSGSDLWRTGNTHTGTGLHTLKGVLQMEFYLIVCIFVVHVGDWAYPYIVYAQNSWPSKNDSLNHQYP